MQLVWVRNEIRLDDNPALFQVPELSGIDAKDIHNPPSLLRQSVGYPKPIIDYKFARERVLERFKNLSKDKKA